MMTACDRVSYPWSLLYATEARIEVAPHLETDDLRVLHFLYLDFGHFVILVK